jgi:phosphopantothenoylcysteine decarboxylase/phosphopantothenate--cysteine ligase
MLNGKHILLGVTGGIAAIKAVELASRLIKAGATVRVILTENATRFVSPLTFAAITHDRVATEMFILKDPTEHISLADWADLLVIAPATANIIGKLSHGLADDLLSTCALAHYRTKLLVPAMNVHMFQNPVVADNLSRLAGYDWRIMPPERGRLACGTVGEGRMPEPVEIMEWVESVLMAPCDLVGKHILVSAGACREALDPVRYISNRSSGKMGLAIARAAAIRGARVTLVHGAIESPVPYYIDAVSVESAEEMREALLKRFPSADILFMAAAVTDYTLVPERIKRPKSEHIALELTATPDILAELGAMKTHQTIVGFAMESENVAEKGRAKMERKHCDFLAANHASVAGKADTIVEWLSAKGSETLSGSKFAVAHAMLDRVWESR